MTNTSTRIEFYLTSSGRNPVGEFLCNLSDDIRLDFTAALNLLKMGHVLKMPLSRNLSSIYPGLHELRFKDRHGQVRIFYFVKKNDAVYMMHAIQKKTQEIPKREIDVVLKRIREL
jgi:phage-related protein